MISDIAIVLLYSVLPMALLLSIDAICNVIEKRQHIKKRKKFNRIKNNIKTA